MKSQDAGYWINEGNEAYKAGDYDKAIEHYRKTTQLKPNEAVAFHNWGLALYNLAYMKQDVSLYEKACDQYAKAIQYYGIATHPNPNKANAFCNWGYTLYALAKINHDENLHRNIETFENASKEINDPDTFLIKGELYFILNQEGKSKECFKNSQKDILEILTFLDKDNREKIIETEMLNSLLDDNNFFKETTKVLT